MSDKLKELKKKRGYAKASLTRIENLSASLTKNESAEVLYVHLELLEKAFVEFEEMDRQIVEIDEAMSEMDEFTGRYAQLKAKLKALAQGSSPMLKAMQTQIEETVKSFTFHQKEMLETMRDQSFCASPKEDIELPQLSLPCFYGDYEQFLTFKDLFESSVHSRSNLTNVRKFQLLKTHLKGEAQNLIRNIPISNATYESTWKKVCERYYKEDIIVTKLISKFMNQPSSAQQSVKHLRSMCDTSDEVVRGLEVLGVPAEARDCWLIHILLCKLDERTRQQWASDKVNETYPTFTSFLKFLEKKCSALEKGSISSNKPMHHKSTAKSFVVNVQDGQANYNQGTKPKGRGSSSVKCPLCQQEHNLYDCEKYKSLSVKDRKQAAIDAKVCFNCLYPGHSGVSCPSRRSCYVCRRKHHTSLHEGLSSSDNFQNQGKHPEPATSSRAMCVTLDNDTINSMQVVALPNKIEAQRQLLPTAVVKLYSDDGRFIVCRILLDSGSQATLITQNCVQNLSIKRRNCRLPISGLISSSTTKGAVTLSISPHYSNETKIKLDALIVDKLQAKLPRINQNIIQSWTELNTVSLADPLSSEINNIDLILGADHFFEILGPGKLIGPNKLIAQETSLGWVICGGYYGREILSAVCNTDFNVDKILQQFWELEEINIEKELAPEHKICENLFQTTTVRNHDGRFVVRLPFTRDPKTYLGESLGQAVSRFKAIERRLQADTKLKQEYITFMNDYREQHHMQECEPLLNLEHAVYLPHHPVIRLDSLTTKVRVVFDGSAKTTSKQSLNNILAIGPTIQPELMTTLMRFRRHKVAITADIKQMYRQVLVNESDCDYQRIVWRDDPHQKLKHYKLLTVTYGTGPASFLATRALQQLGIDNKSDFPLTSDVILSDFYVDDLLSGAESVENAKQLIDDLQFVLQSGGFILRKWVSNSSDIMEFTNKNCNNTLIDIDKNSNHKVLGLFWDPRQDSFKFKVNFGHSANILTKRTFLSESARLFDPVGWLAPVTITIKIMYQELWRLRLNWDDELPKLFVDKWLKIKQEMKALENIIIKRFHPITPNTILHGFCDASKAAYSAVVYLQSFTTCHIVAAKTKVAPLSSLTIPRLELSGALLLAKLMKRVQAALQIPSSNIKLWTDSEIVIHWLSQDSNKWKQFVSNRCYEIKKLVPNTVVTHSN